MISLVAQTVKKSAFSVEDGFNPCTGKIPWKKEWPPIPVFLPGEFHDRGAWRATIYGVGVRHDKHFLFLQLVVLSIGNINYLYLQNTYLYRICYFIYAFILELESHKIEINIYLVPSTPHILTEFYINCHTVEKKKKEKLKPITTQCGGLVVENPPEVQEMQETWVLSLCGEDPLEEEITTHSSILAWEIPWTVEPGRLQSIWSQRVEHDWAQNRIELMK